MKKLIMMFVFALGTISASASNDLFKNHYQKNVNEDPIILLEFSRRHYVRQVNLDSNGGIYETIIYDVTLCGDNTSHSYHAFITNEYYILNNKSGMPRFYNVQDIGICFSNNNL